MHIDVVRPGCACVVCCVGEVVTRSGSIFLIKARLEDSTQRMSRYRCGSCCVPPAKGVNTGEGRVVVMVQLTVVGAYLAVEESTQCALVVLERRQLVDAVQAVDTVLLRASASRRGQHHHPVKSPLSTREKQTGRHLRTTSSCLLVPSRTKSWGNGLQMRPFLSEELPSTPRRSVQFMINK